MYDIIFIKEFQSRGTYSRSVPLTMRRLQIAMLFPITLEPRTPSCQSDGDPQTQRVTNILYEAPNQSARIVIFDN